MDSQSGYIQITRSPISYTAQFGYSVGHILNDLCSACWFTYIIIYFTDVQKQSKDFAGVLMLVGQIADGLATPVVGILIDKVNSRYGKRKTWHGIGTLCVALSFAFIFHKCLACSSSACDTSVRFVYYGAFIVLFQFGWASTQISHLSLIPVLTVCKKKIVFLNSIRSGLTFVCGIGVYVLMWVLLHRNGSENQPVGPDDATAFSYLSFVVIGVGATFSLVFHVMVRESSDAELQEQMDEQTAMTTKHIEQRNIKDWFKLPKFYLVGLMYMCTRLAVNVPQVYLPLYLTYTLKLHKESIAYFPLMMLICSVIGSFIARASNKLTGSKRVTYIGGVLLVVGSSVWFFFQKKETSCYTYGATALIGAGTSIMLVMSLSMTADLIGVHTKTGAFVYGSMSLLDKISNGIVIAVIQHLHPQECHALHCPIATYYRYIMTFVSGIAAILGAITTIIIAVTVYRKRHAALNTYTSTNNSDRQGPSSKVIQNQAIDPVICSSNQLA